MPLLRRGSPDPLKSGPKNYAVPGVSSEPDRKHCLPDGIPGPEAAKWVLDAGGRPAGVTSRPQGSGAAIGSAVHTGPQESWQAHRLRQA